MGLGDAPENIMADDTPASPSDTTTAPDDAADPPPGLDTDLGTPMDMMGDQAPPPMPTARPAKSRRNRTAAPAFNEVSVELSVVLGRASMPIHQLLKMGRGAVIEFGAHVDDDALIYANNRLIARGQVVVVGENIAVSITETVPITET